jgi:uncharacterized protein
MNRWFVDTYFLVALVSPDDEGHAHAMAFAREHGGRFYTTQWVFMELLDGCADGERRIRAAKFVEIFSRGANVTVIPASDDWFQRGLRLYADRPDKEWSLTDCISFLVMQDHGLQDALTADHHFAQAGFTAVLKEE